MLETIKKIGLVSLILIVLWLVAIIGFAIFRIIVGLLTVGALVGVGALIYHYTKK